MRSVYACIVIPATVVVTVHTLYMCAGVCAQYCGLWLVLVKLRRHAREGERHGGVPGMYVHVRMHENVYIDCMTCGERHGGVPGMYIHVHMHENVYIDCMTCGERHGGVPDMYVHVRMHENVYIDCMTCGERHGGVPGMYVHVRMHENVYADCTMCGGALDRWSGYVRACTCT